MTSSTAKPRAIAAFETRIIFRHRSATSASSSSRASISEISSIGSSSAIKFEFLGGAPDADCARGRMISCQTLALPSRVSLPLGAEASCQKVLSCAAARTELGGIYTRAKYGVHIDLPDDTQ